MGAQAARMAAQRDGRREGRRLRCLRRSSPRCTPCCANPWYLLPCTPSLRLRMYAFDVHCNAFFPCFLLLWVLQLPLCPLLLSHTLLARAASAGERPCGGQRLPAWVHNNHAVAPLAPAAAAAPPATSLRCLAPAQPPTLPPLQRCGRWAPPITSTSPFWATPRCPSWSAQRWVGCTAVRGGCGRSGGPEPPAAAAAHRRPARRLPPQAFLYPIGAVVVLLPLSLLLGVNPTRVALRFVFGYT